MAEYNLTAANNYTSNNILSLDNNASTNGLYTNVGSINFNIIGNSSLNNPNTTLIRGNNINPPLLNNIPSPLSNKSSQNNRKTPTTTTNNQINLVNLQQQQQQQQQQKTTVWNDVFDEITSGAEYAIRSNLAEILELLRMALEHQSWKMRIQAAYAICTVVTKLQSQIDVDSLDLLLKMLIASLTSRTWSGKVYIYS